MIGFRPYILKSRRFIYFSCLKLFQLTILSLNTCCTYNVKLSLAGASHLKLTVSVEQYVG